jgi:PKD repeat protein
VTNWEWTFPGGSPSTSNKQNPNVTYSTSGYKNITLKVSNSAGSDSTTKSAVFYITANPEKVLPFVESFEDSTSFPGTDGFIVNPSGVNPWKRVTNTSGSTWNLFHYG